MSDREDKPDVKLTEAEDVFDQKDTCSDSDVNDEENEQIAKLELDRGASVGRYVILDVIGEGGMGKVYQAYDPELDRRIALKLLSVKKAIGSESQVELARERLLREAQALAQLAHPNVVSAYDVGAIGNQVFIAMELVEGKTLSQWIKSDKLSVQQIVNVLVAAGRGMVAAHQVGLIHRDFKPDNIIVGNDGRARVLDFGLARSTTLDKSALLGNGTDPTLSQESRSNSQGNSSGSTDDHLGSVSKILRSSLTMTGAVVGTPGYMSPEQCLGDKLDEQSDQFSFCATLYFALYKVKAFNARSFKELKNKVIKGQITPPPPAAKVSRRLHRIALRGLSVDRKDRYPSMEVLLADLSKDPRATLRHGLLAVIIIILMSLAAYGLLRDVDHSLCQSAKHSLAAFWNPPQKTAIREAFEATRRSYAGDTFKRVEKIIDAYAVDWVQMANDSCAATHIHGVQSERLMDLRKNCLDRKLTQFAALIDLFAGAPDAEIVDKAVKIVMDLSTLSQCKDTESLLATIAPPEDPKIRARVKELRQQLDRADVLQKTGKYKPGLAQIIKITKESAELGYLPFHAEARFLQATVKEFLGEFHAAEQEFKETIWAAADAGDSKLVAKVWISLLMNLAQQNKFEDALALETVVGVAVALAGREPLLTADMKRALGRSYYEQGKFELGRKLFEQALTLRKKVLGSSHLKVSQSMIDVGNTLYRLGHFDECRKYYQKALIISERTLGPEHPNVGWAIHNLGMVFFAKGNYDEALKLYKKAHEIQKRSHNPDDPDLATGLQNMGILATQIGDFASAKKYMMEALKIYRHAFGEDHVLSAVTLSGLGDVLVGLNDKAGAYRAYQRSLDMLSRVAGPDHPMNSYALTGLGSLLLTDGRVHKALPLLERGLGIREKETKDPMLLGDARFTLARALWRAGKERKRSIQLAEMAQKDFLATDNRGQSKMREVQNWLGKRR